MKKQYPMNPMIMRTMMITRTMAIFVIVPLFCSRRGTGFALGGAPILMEVKLRWKAIDGSVPKVESEDVGSADVGEVWKQMMRTEVRTTRRKVLRLGNDDFMMNDVLLR